MASAAGEGTKASSKKRQRRAAASAKATKVLTTKERVAAAMAVLLDGVEEGSDKVVELCKAVKEEAQERIEGNKIDKRTQEFRKFLASCIEDLGAAAGTVLPGLVKQSAVTSCEYERVDYHVSAGESGRIGVGPKSVHINVSFSGDNEGMGYYFVQIGGEVLCEECDAMAELWDEYEGDSESFTDLNALFDELAQQWGVKRKVVIRLLKDVTENLKP